MVYVTTQLVVKQKNHHPTISLEIFALRFVTVTVGCFKTKIINIGVNALCCHR